jgi:hypothetical protein
MYEFLYILTAVAAAAGLAMLIIGTVEKRIVLCVVGPIVTVLAIALMYWTMETYQDQFERSCMERGGYEVVDLGDDEVCVTEDGRIVL